MTEQRRQELKDTYSFVFSVFATTRSEVADHFGISKNAASSRLKALQRHRLADSIDVNDEAQGNWRRGEYKELTWQTWPTYDDYTLEQALEQFFEKEIPACT